MNPTSTTKTINISVRNLVEFILRSGDIDSAYMGMKRMREGAEAHKKLQSKRKKEASSGAFLYESEVTLKYSFPYNDFVYNLDGRADGIIIRDGRVCIEEIKSTHKPLADIDVDNAHWHFAQAKCYAFMYCELNGITEIDILLTYLNCDTYETLELHQSLCKPELEAFFFNLAAQYYAFAKMDYDRIYSRNETVRALTFPFCDYRKNQRAFMAAVYKSIKQGIKLFAQAPTGTGKTISTLYPAIKALAEGMADKIFYLTAKTTTRHAAEEAFALMTLSGLNMRVITLTGKEKICLRGEIACNPIDCPYALGHFDRVNDAVMDLIENETNISRHTIITYAQKHNVCPFEFELDATLFCDCIICDYNYVYNPKTQLKRFFNDVKLKMVILTDEAHNLADRARDMFSASLLSSAFVSARRALKQRKLPLYESMSRIILYMKDMHESYLTDEPVFVTEAAPEELYGLLNEFVVCADKWLVANNGHPAMQECLEVYFGALDFLRISELFDFRYRLYIDAASKNHTLMKLMCLDPSCLLAEIHKKAVSTVFFSATLIPLNYFKDILGGDADDKTIRITSPFDPDNLCLIIENGISTKFKDRALSYHKVTDSIYHFISAKTGNYFVFFSSYAYLRAVLDEFSFKYPEVETVVQRQDMPEDEREAFLARFSPNPSKTLVGFLVLGGVFSEGIDLKGDRLIGAAIVGVGMPLISAERNILSGYYQEQNGMGFEYAYIYPGMNKVLQAAGRVIRQESDKGSVLLIDTRFTQSPYSDLFPPEWSGYKRARGASGIRAMLTEFWK